jgi:hypothetical protein
MNGNLARRRSERSGRCDFYTFHSALGHMIRDNQGVVDVDSNFFMGEAISICSNGEQIQFLRRVFVGIDKLYSSSRVVDDEFASHGHWRVSGASISAHWPIQPPPLLIIATRENTELTMWIAVAFLGVRRRQRHVIWLCNHQLNSTCAVCMLRNIWGYHHLPTSYYTSAWFG